MRWRRVKRISWRGNDEKNRVLRFLYAKKFFELLSDNKRVLVIDETNLLQQDNRIFKWRKRGQTNSVPGKTVRPRISLLAGVDTRGNVYLAIS